HQSLHGLGRITGLAPHGAGNVNRCYSMIDLVPHKRAQKQASGNERGLSYSFLARSSQKTPDCLRGYAVIGGNLAHGVVVFTDTAYHVGPFFRWDAMVRRT